MCVCASRNLPVECAGMCVLKAGLSACPGPACLLLCGGIRFPPHSCMDFRLRYWCVRVFSFRLFVSFRVGFLCSFPVPPHKVGQLCACKVSSHYHALHVMTASEGPGGSCPHAHTCTQTELTIVPRPPSPRSRVHVATSSHAKICPCGALPTERF